MRVRLDLYGGSDAQDTHISIFLIILKGQYDAILTWPFNFPVTFSLFDQTGNAQSGNQASIYSPPFYSSPDGYKMCACLHLCGDGNDQGKYVSLCLALMQGKYDALLPWPFIFRIIFCLYDQTSQQSHIIHSFRPDIASDRFTRPKSNMNITSGIPKLCTLELIQQENNPYVRNNTMFIKEMIDLDQIPDEILPYTLSLNPGIPTHQQRQMIQTEIDKAHQHQSTSDS